MTAAVLCPKDIPVGDKIAVSHRSGTGLLPLPHTQPEIPWFTWFSSQASSGLLMQESCNDLRKITQLVSDKSMSLGSGQG